jgi:Bacteriophage baseplate protein W
VLNDATIPSTGREILGRGWRFPVVPDGLGRLGFSRAEQKIEESIWLILSTSPGERVMLPEFGCGIQDLVFRPAQEVCEVAGTLVRQSLVTFEPRIDVIDVEATFDPAEPNLVLIRVTYSIRSSNAVNNLVYPFSLNEGP